MAADDATALVLRLEARITDFEKALDRAAGVARKRTKEIDTAFAGMNREIGRQLDLLAASAAGNLGSLGAIVGRLGPVGIAAAAGLGVLVATFIGLSRAADQFATEMGKIKDIASQTGLATTLVQALSDAGVQFAVAEEKMGQGLVRLAAQMEQFSRAEGDLFRIINRVDPELAKQIALARDFGQQLDLLAVALNKAGSAFPAVARAAFGRAGIELAQTLREVARTGGLKELEQQFIKTGDSIDNALTQEVVRLKREIEDMSGDAQRNLASIFSKQILADQKQATELWLQFSRAAKEFSTSGSWTDFVRSVRELAATTGLGRVLQELGGLQVAAPPRAPAPAPAAAADPGIQQRIQQTFQLTEAEKQQSLAIENQIKAIQLRQGLINRALSTEATSLDDVNRLKDEELETEKELIEVGRKRADFETTINKRRVQELGDAATQADKRTLKEQETDQAVRQGNISQEERNRILTAARLAQEAHNTAIRVQLGIAGEEEIVKQKLNQLEQQRALGLRLSAEEARRAEAIIRQEAQKTLEEMQIRASKLPQLLRFSFDARNLGRQLDQFMTSAFGNFENAIAGVVSGTQKLEDAFRSMTQAIIADLTRLMLRMTITGPLAQSLHDTFGGLIPRRAAGGPVMAGHPYMVGERGPELFVPGRQGVIVPNSARAGAATINVNMEINLRGANGDETIARVSRQAAVTAATEAFRQAQKAMPGRQMKLHMLGT